MTTSEYRLPDDTRIAHAHLVVADLERALAFYANLMGLSELRQEGQTAVLSADGTTPHLLLTEQAGARPKPPGTTGLFHVAILLPDRQGLARLFRQLLEHDYPFDGASDHGVSEALYLSDPDGNGLELYRDRAREEWPRRNGQLAMGNAPLDLEGLLAEADDSPWEGIALGTCIGHVHLQVSDLARAVGYYRDVLGLDVMQDTVYMGAAFLSAGGYHHHLGLNTWAGVGAPPPPPDAVGLRSYALHLPDTTARDQLIQRVRESGHTVEVMPDGGHGEATAVRDPDGNLIELVVERPAA